MGNAMTMGVQFEHAAIELRKLLEDDATKPLRGANEAETRLLLIDKVLEILGWPKLDFHPEKVTPNGEYTDYRLSIDGQSRLIVEAKRFGLIEPLPKLLRNREYKNGTLRTACGSLIERLVKQCRSE